MLATRLSGLLLCAFGPLACATTSGQDWLNTPLDPTPTASTALVTAPVEPASEARPRLRHSITLGESYVGSATSAAAPSSGSALHVSVHTYVPVAVTHYGAASYGYGSDHPARPPQRTSPSSGVQPGQDFPPPPSYGPSFPSHTAPASPWAR